MPPMTNAASATPGPFMTIGEAARRSGFTIKALRFYERRGLLPTSSRGVNGYRLYGETDLQRLSFIRDAKVLGLTLSAIAGVVGTANGSRRKRLLVVLDHRIAEATDRIAALTRLREELERHRRIVAQGRPSGGNRDHCSCLKPSEPAG